MNSISIRVGAGSRVLRRGASKVGLVALGVLALACGAPESSDAPEETIGTVEEAIGGPLCAAASTSANPGSYSLINNVSGQSERYSDTNNQTFLLNVEPEMPFIAPHENPYDNSLVYVVKGYAGGHSAIDYYKVNAASDPSYNVRSMAPGMVVSVGYDNVGLGVGMGNYVVIEHTAPTGKRYRSLYAHLRNGAQNDCLAAKAFVANPPPGSSVIPAYAAYINSQNCSGTLSTRAWGTVAERILVTPGQQVDEGQQIARAGNTGMGGVVQGLNSNGTFKDSTYNNVHLHLYFAVEDTTGAAPPGSGAQWVHLDPYGAYATTANGCYTYGANVAGHRLLAPFSPTFAGVPYDAYRWYFDYYPSMGYAPQTVSLYPSGSQQLVAGSFQPGRSPEWFSAINQTKNEFLAVLNQHAASGYQLREVQLSLLQGGAIRYNGIWARRTGTNPYTVVDDNDAQWTQRLQTESNAGRHPVDEVTYMEAGMQRHAGSFVGDGAPPSSFNMTWGRTLSSFNSFVAAEANFGRKPTSISAEPGNTTFGGMFTAAQGDWVLETEIAGVSNFARRERSHVNAGRRLYRVQGYGDGQKFAAIWVGQERPPSAIITTSGTTTCGSASPITLDARTSIFDAAFPLGYEWTAGNFGVLNGPLQTVNLPIGSHLIQLRAWDGRGLESITTALVDIAPDTTPPSLTAPSSRTISSCTNADIGNATASDACGSVTITNDKPATFPLGNTTVRWTARDQAGNTTTRTQVVTAVLGDNPNCCPAGTTYIPGSAVGETLTGTSASECILGFGGNDTINGNGGDDYISGGSGNDTLNGGSGSDRCYGGSGTDTLSSTCESQTP